MGLITPELPVTSTEYYLMSPDEKIHVAILGHRVVAEQLDVTRLDDSYLADMVASASGCDFEAAMLVTLAARYPGEEK